MDIIRNNLNIFEQKATELLTKRKLCNSENVALTAFNRYFIAHAWLEHCREGDGLEMLELLMQDENLIDGCILDTNHGNDIVDGLYPTALKNNKTWLAIAKILLEFKGKGLGVGELFLSLVIRGWELKFGDSTGDGRVNGKKVEVKNEGASLKPIKENLRIIDLLNKTVFQGHRPGAERGFKKHKEWINSQPNKVEIYQLYYSQLYPDQDVEQLIQDLLATDDYSEYQNILGRKIITWYQKVDDWGSLIVLDLDNMKYVNIADPTDLSFWPDLHFSWKSMRKGDSQALADGYANIHIAPKPEKKKKRSKK